VKWAMYPALCRAVHPNLRPFNRIARQPIYALS
jgi:hypothetical protein